MFAWHQLLQCHSFVHCLHWLREMKARESSWQRNLTPCIFGDERVCRLMQLFSWPTVLLWLVISDRARVLSMPSRIYLPLGMTGRIDCPVEANPPVTLIQWSKDEVHLMNHSHVKVNKQGTLIISSVLASDQGQYSCRPYSPLGEGQNSMPIQVIVKGQYLVCMLFYVDVCVWMHAAWATQSVVSMNPTIPALRGLCRLSMTSLDKLFMKLRFIHADQVHLISSVHKK